MYRTDKVDDVGVNRKCYDESMQVTSLMVTQRGSSEGYPKLAEVYYDASINVVSIDTAHCHWSHSGVMTKVIKRDFVAVSGTPNVAPTPITVFVRRPHFFVHNTVVEHRLCLDAISKVKGDEQSRAVVEVGFNCFDDAVSFYSNIVQDDHSDALIRQLFMLPLSHMVRFMTVPRISEFTLEDREFEPKEHARINLEHDRIDMALLYIPRNGPAVLKVKHTELLVRDFISVVGPGVYIAAQNQNIDSYDAPQLVIDVIGKPCDEADNIELLDVADLTLHKNIEGDWVQRITKIQAGSAERKGVQLSFDRLQGSSRRCLLSTVVASASTLEIPLLFFAPSLVTRELRLAPVSLQPNAVLLDKFLSTSVVASNYPEQVVVKYERSSTPTGLTATSMVLTVDDGYETVTWHSLKRLVSINAAYEVTRSMMPVELTSLIREAYGVSKLLLLFSCTRQTVSLVNSIMRQNGPNCVVVFVNTRVALDSMMIYKDEFRVQRISEKSFQKLSASAPTCPTALLSSYGGPDAEVLRRIISSCNEVNSSVVLLFDQFSVGAVSPFIQQARVCRLVFEVAGCVVEGSPNKMRVDQEYVIAGGGNNFIFKCGSGLTGNLLLLGSLPAPQLYNNLINFHRLKRSSCRLSNSLAVYKSTAWETASPSKRHKRTLEMLDEDI
jgi:hypothetical protein